MSWFHHLQVSILLVRKRHSCGIRHLLLVLVHDSLVDGDLRGSKSCFGSEFLVPVSVTYYKVLLRNCKGTATYQTLVADEFPRKPQEGFLEVVVGLGGDVVVLQVLLAVESDCLGLDLSLLHIDLVAAKDDRDVLADTDEIT